MGCGGRKRLTDVGVVDLCEETNLWWAHGVFFWQEELQTEDTIWRVNASMGVDHQVRRMQCVREMETHSEMDCHPDPVS